MGQGLGRRPRHPDRGRSRRAARRSAARADRGVPGPRARGRDGRGVRLHAARQGRRGAVDRHRHARPRRRCACRPSAPRLGNRDRHGGGRRGAHLHDLRRQGGLGAMASARLPAGPRHRRHQGGEPVCDRLHPRRPRHHRVGRHQRGDRGQLALDHRHRRDVHRGERPPRAVRSGRSTASAHCPRPSAARAPPPSRPRSARSSRPTSRRSARSPTTPSCSTSSPPRSTRVSRRWARAAPTTSCAPRSSPWCSTCRPPRPSRSSSPVWESCTSSTASTTRPTTTPTRPPTPPPSAAPTRRSCSSPASACSATAPTSRRRASPASSTSTRST